MGDEGTDWEGDNGGLDNSQRLIALALLGVIIGSIVALTNTSLIDNDWAGFGFLLAIPAAIGGLISLASDPQGQQNPLGCFLYPTLGIISTLLLAWALLGEGAICIAMVLPLWIPAAVGGFLVQRWSASRRRSAESKGSRLNAIGWLALPVALMWADMAAPPAWEDRVVVRSIIIDAPVEAVWPLLVSIPDIRPDEGRATWAHDVFGVPRPSGAQLVIRDGALIRKARWGSDIRFEERVTSLEPGRRISWRFAFPDRSVERYTDPHISPDGALLKIASGEYRLQPLGPNRTLLTLETRYEMRARLAGYAALWGELFLGDIGENVLALVADRAEAGVESPSRLSAQSPVSPHDAVKGRS